MKNIITIGCLIVVLLIVAGLTAGGAQNGSPVVPPTHDWAGGNPLKIALLKWYPINLTTSFKAGANPYGVAFDGANIWVTNNGDTTVTKLRANDGANLGTFTVGGGQGAPMGLAFDGANMWVVNSFPNTVTKLRASDGANLGDFAVGKVPYNAAFDGQAIWVTNSQSASITKLRASDGKVLGTFADSEGPIAILCDGTYMWVSNFQSSVSRYKLDGTAAGTFKIQGGFAYQLAFDGENIWVPAAGTLTQLRASDGKTVAVYNGYGIVTGIAFDGQNLWLATAPYMNEVRRSDGKILLQRRANSNRQTQGLAFDGANIWAAGWGSDTALKF